MEATSLALIDIRKKDITPFTPHSEDLYKNAMKHNPMQSRALLSELLQSTLGNKSCTILNQPDLHIQKQQVKSTKGASLTIKTNPR